MLNDHLKPGEAVDSGTIAGDLATLEDIVVRLWPWLRRFALAGASPDALEAVDELAVYLGYSQHQAVTDAVKKAQDATVKALCQWMRDSREGGPWRGKIGHSDFDQLVRDIESEWKHAKTAVDAGGRGTPEAGTGSAGSRQDTAGQPGT